MEPISPEERCPLCFSPFFCQVQGICSECQTKNHVLHKVASVFDYEGPPATLIRQIKYGNKPYLAEGAGSFLAVQFLRLNWPMPDVIVPVPISTVRRLERGYNQSELLCQPLAKAIDRPIVSLLRRKSGEFSQAGLSRQQRLTLDSRNLFLKQEIGYEGKIILLVDDVMTTGSTLHRCAEVLLDANPRAIYGLTLCRTL